MVKKRVYNWSALEVSSICKVIAKPSPLLFRAICKMQAVAQNVRSSSLIVSFFLQKSYTDMLTCNMKNAHMFGCVSIISIEM